MEEIIALVTDRRASRRLILAGAEMARREKKELRVISVQPRDTMGNGQALEDLFSVSRSVHAQMTVYYHDDAQAVAVRTIRRCRPYCLIAGKPQTPDKSAFLGAIAGSCGEVPMHLIDSPEEGPSVQTARAE